MILDQKHIRNDWCIKKLGIQLRQQGINIDHCKISKPLTGDYQDEEETQDTMGLTTTSSSKISLQHRMLRILFNFFAFL